MKIERINTIIWEYKKQFQRIHKMEINKWRAIKHFRENWNADSNNFSEMLENALKYSKNLLDSGSYFPKRMLTKYLEEEPEKVKSLFLHLFNEEEDLFQRITFFQTGIKKIHQHFFKSIKNNFQDHRAIIFYLCMMYPERYYLYKFEMLKKISKLLQYPYDPKRGKQDNLIQFFTLCNFINHEIKKDDELIKMHHDRLNEDYYQDTELHVLTQDIIYASVKHLKFKFSEIQERKSTIEVINEEVIPETIDISFDGQFVNFIENEKEQKRLGNLGELIVLNYEEEKLARLGTVKKPSHDANKLGDGIGYDISSVDHNNKKIFIEVKATRGNKKTPFFITQNELLRSKKEQNAYLLYRLYELDEKNMSAKMFVITGDLSNYCTLPVKYKVAIKKAKTESKLS